MFRAFVGLRPITTLSYPLAFGALLFNTAIEAKEFNLFDMSIEELIQVTVTSASKNPEDLMQASATTYVFTAEDIKLYGWRTLADIMHAVPNTDLQHNYDYTSINHRGFSGDGKQSLILINGVENNEVFDFNSQLRGWNAANEIERVEVLMGPNSTLYGTSALLSVINIVTKNKEQPDTGQNIIVSYDGANNSLAEASATKVGNNHRFGFSISAQRFNNDDDRVKQFTADDVQFSRTATTDPYRDHNPNNVRLLDETFSFDGHLELYDFYAGFRMSSQSGTQGLDRTRFQWGENTAELRRQTLFVGYQWQAEKWHWDNRISYRQTNRDYTFSRLNNVNVDQGLVTTFSDLWGVDLSALPHAQDFTDLSILLSGAFSDEGEELAWQSTLNYELSETGQIKIGFDHKTNDYRSAFSQENRSRPRLEQFFARPTGEVSSAFAQLTYQLYPEKLTLVTGLRVTDDQHPWAKETSFVSPRISLIYRPSERSSWRATYNEGFRQEYRQDFNINPEYMDLFELQYSLQDTIRSGGSYHFSVTPYHMKSKGLIREIINPDQNARQRVIISNGADYSVTGIESLFRFKKQKWSGMLGWRWLQSGQVDVNLLQEDQQKIFNNVPQFKFQIGGGYQFEHAIASLFLDYWDKTKTETFYADHRTFESNGSTLSKKEVLEVDNMVLLNLFLSSKDFIVDDAQYRVFAEIYNVLDHDNYHVNDAPSPVQFLQPGRTLRIGFELAY